MITKAKFLVRRVLCNGAIGSVLRRIYRRGIPDIRWKGYRFHLPASGVSDTNVAAIFWGFYESAEIRLIRKYLDGNQDVVELGGSLGIVSGHIASRLQPGKRLITIEANPRLIPSISENIRLHAAAGSTSEVLNYAIDYHSPQVLLQITDDNTETRVSGKDAGDGEGVVIGTLTLSDVLDRLGLNEFTLVTDIEGAEIQLILGDEPAMRKCRHLFIELHDTAYDGKKYSIREMIGILTEQLGFRLKEQQGPVCYFYRKP